MSIQASASTERKREGGGAGSLRDAVYDRSHRLADYLGEHAGLCLLFLVLCYLPTVVVEAYIHPLRHDELFTWHLARTAGLGKMLALVSRVEPHPPLIYILEHWTLQLGPERWLLARLPSMVLGLVATISIFRYVARRLETVFGFLAVGMFWLSPAFEWSWQDRDYMLWLAGVALLLQAWDAAARDGRSRWRLLAVLGCAVLVMEGHVLAPLSLLPFVVAEVVRGQQRRHMDWWLLGALIAPLTIAATYVHKVERQDSVLYPSSFLASGSSVGGMYAEPVVYFSLGLLFCLFFLCFAPEPERLERRPGKRPARHEMTLYWGLFLVPVLCAGTLRVRDIAFFPRYGIVGTLGCGLLLTWLIYLRVRTARVVCACFAVALLLANVGRLVHDGGEITSMSPYAEQELRYLDATLPVVAASGMTYVEMDDREPDSVLAHTYYVSDREDAVRYSHATLFEDEVPVWKNFGLRGKVEPYTAFVAEHRRFYVVGTYTYEEDWLLRKLKDAGAELVYEGKFRSSYKDDDLYLVRMDPGR